MIGMVIIALSSFVVNIMSVVLVLRPASTETLLLYTYNEATYVHMDMVCIRYQQGCNY